MDAMACIYLYINIYIICSCQPRVQHGRNAPPCSSCQGIITHTFQLSEIQKAFIVATEHPGCQTKKTWGNFSCLRHLFTHLFIPGSFLFMLSDFFSVPYFFHLLSRSRTTIFWAELAIKIPYLKDPSLLFHEHFSGICSMYFVAALWDAKPQLRYQDNVIKVALEL